MPHLSPSARRWLHRPGVLAVASTGALAVLLTSGLLVARAVGVLPSGTAADSTATLATSPTPTASTPGSSTDSGAVAVNTTDGRTVYAIKLRLVQTTKDVVDATNAAVAVASCTDCTTVAIAFEGVLVAGSPSTFDPTNLALALNVGCSGCTTFATAYQQVVQSSTRVRITGAGRRKVAAIRRDLESLRHENLPLDQVVARVKADEQAFADVLLHDVVPVGHVTEPAPAAGTDISDNPASPAPSATDAPTPAATDAASPAATATLPASPTTDPTPSASPTTTP